jgi:hypothetical protein
LGRAARESADALASSEPMLTGLIATVVWIVLAMAVNGLVFR